MFYKMFPWEGLDPSPFALGVITYLQTLRCPPPPRKIVLNPPLPSQDKILTPHSFRPVEQERTAHVLVRTPIRNSISRVECLLCRSGVQCTAPPPDIETMHHAHGAREERCDNVAVSSSWAARPTKPALTSHLISPSFLRNTDFVTREVAPLNCNISSNNQWSIVG